MITIDDSLRPEDLEDSLHRMWEASGRKILAIERDYDFSRGSPVYTAEGRYTTRGWTEWTEGFCYGSAILQYDATADAVFLELGREATRRRMAGHLTHFGVHDHGFNNLSTYGNLLRLARELDSADAGWEIEFHALALKVSGAVQARRWTSLPDGLGYVYSFNGPHSLFADTMRSMRALAVAHLLGQKLLGEGDRAVSLLDRMVRHSRTTSRYTVYYGEGRDSYDLSGRVAHESIFNLNDGSYRCPSTQQGFSPFSTWTRGLAWIMLGYAELLEFLPSVADAELEPHGGRNEVTAWMERACRVTCDFYLEQTPTDGIPYWDTAAPGLAQLGDYRDRPSDPFNAWEPVDGSAAAIAAQGLLRYGRYKEAAGDPGASRYWQAGLTTARTLLSDVYLDTSDTHQGLLLHSIYHRPNGWDHVPSGRRVPSGESSMWGDYHLRELALYLLRIVKHKPYLTFFDGALRWPDAR